MKRRLIVRISPCGCESGDRISAMRPWGASAVENAILVHEDFEVGNTDAQRDQILRGRVVQITFNSSPLVILGV
jgi:hypothetical protein